VAREFDSSAVPDETEFFRTSHLARFAADQALADAGWEPEALRGLRVGVVVGTTVGVTLHNETFYRRYRAGERPGPGPFRRWRRSQPADHLARLYGLNGPRLCVANACSSGTDALGIGAGWIRSGVCDVVLAGGADELCRITYSGFISLLVTSSEPCRPFDKDRKGLNLGEGAGMLVLESEKIREGRGKRARARVLGTGLGCDAYHLTAPHPNGTGLRLALAQAFDQWGGDPRDLAFINCHGTSTVDNDRVEGRVLADLFPSIPFLSTKGYTGHTLGAAGALEAAFTIGALERGRIPASAGFAVVDPAIGLSPVTGTTPIRGGAALSQSLAFGGSNGVVLLGAGE
jgi:3-oxoacyl-[acyl-carrier-protein] synthase-1/3-oxoacyl-[acyl-carrier-protein] synthase II